MKTVSNAYLEALKDERELLRQLQERGEYDIHTARGILANCRATRAQGWSGEMADYMRAGVDFWAGQVRKLERKTLP